MQSAGVRATDAYASIRRHAERVADEIDDVTAPHGVPTADLDEEDSMVVAVEKVIQLNTSDDSSPKRD